MRNKFKIFTGIDYFNQTELFQVIGVNNDYIGEWHSLIEDAENELKNL